MTLKELLTQLEEELKEILSEGLRYHDCTRLKALYENYFLNLTQNKAMAALSECIEYFLKSEERIRAASFLKLNGVMQKIKVSLLDFEYADKGEEIKLPKLVDRPTRLNEVKHLKHALQMKSGNRLSLIRESIARDTYKTRQLLPLFVANAAEPYGELGALISEEILPYFGRNAVSLILAEISFNGGASQKRLIDFLLTHQNAEETKDLIKKILDRGDLDLKKYLLRTVRKEHLDKDDLEILFSSRSKELKDLALRLIEK